MLRIGIDPGRHTGFAVWDSSKQEFAELSTLMIHEALMRVYQLSQENEICVIFEDARQRKFLPREKSVSEYRGKLMGAGSVKRDCVIWEEFLSQLGVPFTMKAPAKGATKWDNNIFQAITGWKGRTSNHARDAALLVFGK